MANVVAFARCGVLWLWLLYNKQEKKRTSEPGWSKTSFQQLGQLGDSLRDSCGQLGSARVVQNIISTAGTAGGQLDGQLWTAGSSPGGPKHHFNSWDSWGGSLTGSCGQLGAGWAGSWGQLDGQLWTAGSSLGGQLGAAWAGSWEQLGPAAEDSLRGSCGQLVAAWAGSWGAA